jgi:hypothetical protein
LGAILQENKMNILKIAKFSVDLPRKVFIGKVTTSSACRQTDISWPAKAPQLFTKSENENIFRFF